MHPRTAFHFVLGVLACGMAAPATSQELRPQLASVGDVDGDGVVDLVVAGRPASQALLATSEGRRDTSGNVWVLSGRSGCVLHHWRGVPQAEHLRAYGFDVAAAGDVDLDGHADVAVSALDSWRTWPSGPNLAGAVEVRSGRDGMTLRRFPESGSFGGDFGAVLAGGGDFDGDGVPDLAVAAPKDKWDCVRIFSGFDSELLSSYTIRSIDELGRNALARMKSAGIAPMPWGSILAWHQDPLDARRSELLVGGCDVVVALSRIGPPRVSPVGTLGPVWALTELGDLDGDGVRELVGAGFYYAASVFDGLTLASVRQHAARALDPGLQIVLAASVSHLGDLDTDGHGDYLVTSNDQFTGRDGAAAIFSGKSGARLWLEAGQHIVTLPHPATLESCFDGIDGAGLGDVDGDGVPDFALIEREQQVVTAISGHKPNTRLWRLDLVQLLPRAEGFERD
jgi:hypothetical protein